MSRRLHRQMVKGHDTDTESSWRIEGGEVRFDVVVPEGATATVVPPLHPDGLTEQAPPVDIGPEG